MDSQYIYIEAGKQCISISKMLVGDFLRVKSLISCLSHKDQIIISEKALGFKNTIVPYNRVGYWKSLVQQVNAEFPGNLDRNYIQCYAGGARNTPCQIKWDFGIPNIGGRWGAPNRESPSQVQSVMQGWRNSCGNRNSGGFLWVYDDFGNKSQTAQYANAVNTAFSIH